MQTVLNSTEKINTWFDGFTTEYFTCNQRRSIWFIISTRQENEPIFNSIVYFLLERGNNENSLGYLRSPNKA